MSRPERAWLITRVASLPAVTQRLWPFYLVVLPSLAGEDYGGLGMAGVKGSDLEEPMSPVSLLHWPGHS